MASANRPDRADQPSEPIESSPSPPTPVEQARRELLERVVAETIAAGTGGTTAEEHQALLDVARRYRGQPLEHEPVVPELVLAILQRRFSRLQMDAAQWQQVAETVAATLLDAPDVRAHLQVYWDRLGQALP